MRDQDDPSAGAPRSKGLHGQLEAWALALLAAAFEADGWVVEREPGGPLAPDLICRKGQRAYSVVLEASPGKARRVQLRAQLADAVLQARAGAKSLQAQPLAVLAASSLSKSMAEELSAYMASFGDGIAWGAMDDRGRFELHGPGLESIRPVRRGDLLEDLRVEAPPARVVLRNPFSDLGQWMLKVLLAQRVPERWLNAPRDPIRGVADLAEKANVSPASASKFLSALEAGGHLVPADGALSLARIQPLLANYRAASQRPQEEYFVRFLLPAPDPERRLRDVLAAAQGNTSDRLDGEPGVGSSQRAGPPGERACLALFSACRELELGFVRGAPLHLYLESLSSRLLKQLGLKPVEHQAEADLVVRRPRFPEAVFRACVQVRGVAVADALQCWLDVASHPARGAEQAGEIAHKLEMDSWIS